MKKSTNYERVNTAQISAAHTPPNLLLMLPGAKPIGSPGFPVSSAVCKLDLSPVPPLPKFLPLLHHIALLLRTEWLHSFAFIDATGNAWKALPPSYLCGPSLTCFAMSRFSLWIPANSLNHESTQNSPPRRAALDYAMGIKIPLHLKGSALHVSGFSFYCTIYLFHDTW